MHRRPRPVAVAIAVVLTAAVLAVAEPAPPAARAAAAGGKTHLVTVTDTEITPSHLTVQLGDRIAWLFVGFVPREIVEPTFGLFRSPPLLPSAGFEWRAVAAGSFRYYSWIALIGALPVEARLTVRPRQTWLGTAARYEARWAEAGRPLSERVSFDVQRGVAKHVGARVRWVPWLRGTERRSGRAPMACDGRAYLIRVRLRTPYWSVSEWATPTRAMACVP